MSKGALGRFIQGAANAGSAFILEDYKQEALAKREAMRNEFVKSERMATQDFTATENQKKLDAQSSLTISGGYLFDTKTGEAIDLGGDKDINLAAIRDINAAIKSKDVRGSPYEDMTNEQIEAEILSRYERAMPSKKKPSSGDDQPAQPYNYMSTGGGAAQTPYKKGEGPKAKPKSKSSTQPKTKAPQAAIDFLRNTSGKDRDSVIAQFEAKYGYLPDFAK